MPRQRINSPDHPLEISLRIVGATCRDRALISMSECVHYTSDRTHFNPAQVATTLSYFFEALTDKVAQGGCVTVPGFGKFGPRVKNGGRAGKYCRPAFSGSKAFRAYVCRSCPPSIGVDYIKRHMRDNWMSVKQYENWSLPSIAMGCQRSRISVAARKCGYSVEPDF